MSQLKNLNQMERINLTSAVNNSAVHESLEQLIDQQINRIKVEKWVAWEHNHQLDTSSYDVQIQQLKEEKKKIAAALSNLMKQSTTEVSANLELTLN